MVGNNWNSVTVQSLIDGGVITAHKDGNYGSNYPRKDEFGDSGVVFLTAKHLEDSADHIHFENASRLNFEKAKKLKFGYIKEKDVLLSHNATIGRVALVPELPEPVLVGTSLTYYRVDESRLLPGYLASFFRGRDFQNQLAAVMSHSTRNQIPITAQRKLQITLPPLREQKSIASILGTLDAKIELNRRMNETLESLARAIFKSWFVDFDPVRAKMDGRQPTGMDEATAALFPDELVHVDGELIPKGWTSGRIDDLFVLQRGFDLPTKERTPGCFPVIAAGGLHGTHFKAQVSGPGVVTGRSGVLGKVYFIGEDFWPLNTTLWIKEYRGSRPIHAYHLLKTLSLEVFNAGSAVPTLNRNHIHCLPSAVPDLKVVESFETLATPIFEAMRKAVSQSESLATLRDTLLPKLLSGELRVGDAMNQVTDTMSSPAEAMVEAKA